MSNIDTNDNGDHQLSFGYAISEVRMYEEAESIRRSALEDFKDANLADRIADSYIRAYKKLLERAK